MQTTEGEAMTIDDIDAELRYLNQRKRELLIERRRLIMERKPEASMTSEFWVDPVFVIVERYPGISRNNLRTKLNQEFSNPQIDEKVLTNTLTTLRRRGWIENHGTKKNPKWHARGRLPRVQWNTRVSSSS